MSKALGALTLGLVLFTGFAEAGGAHGGHGSPDPAVSSCTDPEAPAALACGLAPSATFDTQGDLWVAWALGGHVYLSRSKDKGASFAPPVPVNRVPERVAADGENRPKVVIDARGRIFVSWTKRLPKPYSGDIRFARSVDGGASFSEPVTINDNRDITSHRFESMAVNGRGELFLAWLDKRDRIVAEKGGRKYSGAALYYTLSTDGGASFRPNRKVADHTCECCRTAMAVDGEGSAVIAWRHIFGDNIRDHAVVRLSAAGDAGPVRRLSFDQWQIDACPHHGPGVAVGADGLYHAVWFNNAPERHGLFYARSADGGASFGEPMAFGRYDAGASHPHVLALRERVYLAWKEFDGERAEAMVMRSKDGGATWSEPAVVATAAGESDHPFLIADGARAYLVWHRRGLPYRPLPVSGEAVDGR